MRGRRIVLKSVAAALALGLVASALAGCEVVEVGLFPVTKQLGAANANRHGLDVHAGQASWVEPGPGGTGPVKFVGEDDQVSTIATQALASWTAIGGFGAEPLVAYRTDSPAGIHIVDPLTSVETTFLAWGGLVPADFGEYHLAMVLFHADHYDLQVIDVRTGAMTLISESTLPMTSVRIENAWIVWIADGKVKGKSLIGPASFEQAPVGSGVTLERAWVAGSVDVSWTEVDGAGYRRIYRLAAGATEPAEVLPGGPSKQMGGFDGDYVTWFEGYGTTAAKARAVAVRNTIMHQTGDQVTYTTFDPSEFAWDFDTLLMQQRGTSKLLLTRFRVAPPRVKGSNRYETVANLALLGGAATAPPEMRAAGDLKTTAQIAAAVEAANEPVVPAIPEHVSDVVVAAGFNNASPDALVAPGLGGVYFAPMLLVEHDSVPRVTADAIKRLRDINHGSLNIRVIGGELAVSKKAFGQLAALRGTGIIERIGGRTAADTAVRVASRMRAVQVSRGETPTAEAVILNGFDRTTWIDGASFGSISAAKHIPVLFTKRYSTPLVTRNALKSLGLTKRYIIGGKRTASDAVRRRLKVASADRIFGRTKYDTSLAVVRLGIAKGWIVPTGAVFVAGYLHEALGASGVIFSIGPGMRAGAVVPSLTGVPVLLTSPTAMSPSVEAFLVERMGPSGAPPGPIVLIIPFLVGGEYSVGSQFVVRFLQIVPAWWFMFI